MAAPVPPGALWTSAAPDTLVTIVTMAVGSGWRGMDATTEGAAAGTPHSGAALSAAGGLSAAGLSAEVVRPGGLWRDIRVVARTGSTNDDLMAAARAGAPEGTVLAAEDQQAGRGRLGRSWVSAPGAALTFSVLLRPAGVRRRSRSWLPLLAGVATATALRRITGIDARLKWPNDVLVYGAKLAGILAEQSGDAVVIGTGINVAAGRDQLPSAAATSLALLGADCTDRGTLLAGLLGELEHWYLRWTGASGWPGGSDPAGSACPAGYGGGDAEASGLRREYLRLCGTVGTGVRVMLPGGQVLAGNACGVDPAGRLVVDSGGKLTAVSAGDVLHVR